MIRDGAGKDFHTWLKYDQRTLQGYFGMINCTSILIPLLHATRLLFVSVKLQNPVYILTLDNSFASGQVDLQFT